MKYSLDTSYSRVTIAPVIDSSLVPDCIGAGEMTNRPTTFIYMNVKIENIEVILNDEVVLVNLRWIRGASRYNNGGNNNGALLKDKYPMRIIIGRLKDKTRYFTQKSN